MPGAKIGERPYLAVPEAGFLGPIFGLISGYFSSDIQSMCTNKTHPAYFYLFTFISTHYLLSINQTLGKLDHY